MSNMYRVEIISNQSVQDDIIELLEQEIPEIQYTILPDCQGRGGRAKKLGNTTWPEMNFSLYTYETEENARKVKAIIKAVKDRFPNEGISLYFTQCIDL